MFENKTNILFDNNQLDKNEKNRSLLQQKMEENLYHALKMAKIGSWMMDLSSGNINWSDETYRICGIQREITPNMDTLLEIIHPEEREFIKNRFKNTINTGEAYDLNHRIVHPDGTERIVHEQGELIYDENNYPIYFMGTIRDITEQMVTRQKLEYSEQRYKSLFKYNQHATYIVDTKGIIQDVNLATELLIGCSKDELIGMPFTPFVDEKDTEHSMEMFKNVLMGEPQSYQLTIINKQGEKREINGSSAPIIVNNKIEGAIGTLNDITEQRIVEKQLENSRQQLLTLIQSMPDFVNFKDDQGRWMLANEFALSLFQLEGIDYQGKTDRELAAYTNFYRKAFITCVDSDEQVWKAGKTVRIEEIVSKPDGRSLVFDVLKTPTFNLDGSRKGIVVVARDVTERKISEEINQYLAYHDSLTSLPNRRNFKKKLEELLLESKETQKKLAVLYLDLDRFKNINDRLGHNIGDELVKSVAERLKSCIPDNGFISRMGGDEFSVILQPINNIDFSVKVAQDIISTIREPFYISAYELYITTSIGISIFPNDGNDVQTLLKDADLALYRAKDKGKNTVEIYNSQMSINNFKTFTLERDLQKAIENEEFEAYYQPRVDSKSGKIVSAEALIRWNHPEWGMVSPNEFIPLAIETGFILDIGQWMKQKVCKQIKDWQLAGHSPIPISVNIDPKRFMQGDFVSSVKKILEDNNLEGKWLEIEITENSLMENEETATHTIKELKRLGVKIALDDFGTGYSAISYLRDFNINCIKIDKSFIQEINSNVTNTKIVKGIIQLAKSLDISVVAEGVEQSDQLLFLREQNCDQIQGFLFSKPVPAGDFEKLLREGRLVPDSNNGKPF